MPEDIADGPLCVDTDVFSYLHLGRGPHYQEFGELVRGRLLLLSFACVGELRAWALRTKLGQRRRDELHAKIRNNYLVLTPTDAVVTKYSELHARFTGRLSGGGQNDMWTAACVLAQEDGEFQQPVRGDRP